MSCVTTTTSSNSGGSNCSSNNSTQGDAAIMGRGDNFLFESMDVNQNKMIDGEIYS